VSCIWREGAGNVQPTLERARPSCWVIRAAGSLISGLALTPGSDPESASSFLRGASSWRSGHPVCGPWRSAARNWRWPCPPRRTQQARTPGRPVRAKLGHAIFLARSDSAFFAACRAALEYAPATKRPQSSLHLAVSICSKLASIPCSVPASLLFATLGDKPRRNNSTNQAA
jgi:hypothetical protein